MRVFGENMSHKELIQWNDVHQKFYDIYAETLLKEQAPQQNDVLQTIIINNEFKKENMPIGPLLMLKDFIPHSQYQRYE